MDRQTGIESLRPSVRMAFLFLGVVSMLLLATGAWAQVVPGQVDFRQCANDNGSGSTNDGIIDACQWTQGALTPNNSDYAESDGVPQRVFVSFSTAGTYDVRITYDFTKNDVYAYDFLVDFDHTMPSGLINPCANLPAFVSAAECQNILDNGAFMEVISDTFDQVNQVEHHTSPQPNPPPPFPDVARPAGRNIFYGCTGGLCPSGTVVSILHSNDPTPGVPGDDCYSPGGNLCGDSTATITVRVTTPVDDSTVGLWFATELAPSLDPDPTEDPPTGWGVGWGSSYAPGASFHVLLVDATSVPGGTTYSLGNQDNQLLNELVEQAHDADLAVTKVDQVDPVIAGNDVTYVVTVTNNGPDTATNTLFVDTFDDVTYMDIISITPSQGSCADLIDAADGEFSCDLGFMDPGDVVTVTIVVSTDPATPDGTVLIDTAVVGGPNVVDDNPSNNTAVESTTVLQATPAQTDLSITKTDNPDPVTAGNALQYTITATNNGPDTAHNVTVIDSLPGGVTFVSAVPTQGSCNAPVGNLLTCNLGTILSGNNAQVVVNVTVDPATRGTLLNTATVAGDESDPTPGNNSVVEDTTVVTDADVAITKSDSPDPVVAGNALTYTLTVTNNGPSTATDVEVEDTLPQPVGTVTFVSASASQGSGCSHEPTTDVVSCSLGTLAPGANATITIIVIPTAAGSITNNCEVFAIENDSVPGNNTDSEDTTVNAPAPDADMSVTKTDSPDPVIAGTQLNYTITVHNGGPNQADNVTLTDTLPVGVTFGSATPAQGSCNPPVGQTFTCALGSMANGADVIINVTVTVNSDVTGTITNTATVSSDANDVTPGNNTDTEDTTVNAEADLEIIKEASPLVVFLGDSVTYTFTVINHGPSDASGIVVTDNLPAGVTYDDANSSTRCDEAGGVVTCDASDLTAGQQRSFSISLIVIDAPATLINFASVAGDQTDPNPGNDTDSTTVEAQVRVVPTLGEWSVILLVVLLALTGAYVVRRRSIIRG